MLALVDAVRKLNSPGDNLQVPDRCGLPSMWFSAEELRTLAQLKLERQASLVGRKRPIIEWSELEVRQLLFLKGISFRSNVGVGEELGVSRTRVYQECRDWCTVFGLTEEVDED